MHSQSASAVAASCLIAAGVLRSTAACAQSQPAEDAAVHGQLTYVEQETDSFAAPYGGPNSLLPDQGRETVDATLYLGHRAWSGAEAWIDAEIDQGFGLANTLGAAGFPSGEAYKVGKSHPYLRLSRAFLRQTWNLGGPSETVDSAQNQLGGSRDSNRLVVTVGKLSVTDVFDTSKYAHDPRADFLNWAALDAATFDYAADAWGYTVGATAEWYAGDWTARAGLFDLSDEPNSPHLDPGAHEFQTVVELERRQTIAGRPTRVLATAYRSHGRMALLDEAVAVSVATAEPVEVAPVRSYRDRTGLSVGVELQASDAVGVFGRAGAASGNVEVYEFTDVDRTISTGLSLSGALWHRGHDTLAAIVIVNDISSARRRFLEAGGLGLLVGDGQLPNAGTERIIETYYDLAASAACHLTMDFQRIVNPGYNRDRGPANVVALRLHAQF